MKKSNLHKWHIIIILAMMFTVGMTLTNGIMAAPKLRLNTSKVSLQPGGTKQLRVKNTAEKVTWSSDNKPVAVINKTGKITAIKAGKAVITAKAGKQKLKCVVTVREKAADTNLALDQMNGKVLWTVSCNEDREDSVTYVAESGEWKKPLGLYSYAADSQNFFVEDSANERIIWHQKNSSASYIRLPKGMICKAMSYNNSNKTLYLLLYDNAAAETPGVFYYKVDLAKGLLPEAIDETAYEYMSILNNDCKPVSGIQYEETRQEIMEEAASITGERMDDVVLCGQAGNYSLYAYKSLEQPDCMRLLLKKGDNMIAYTNQLYVGEFFCNSACKAAYMYKQDGKIFVNYIAQDPSDAKKLMVIQPKFITE